MSADDSVLIIAAHPDDELLGCGGVAALHANKGDRVYSVIVCEGESHRYEGMDVGQENHANQAAEILGLTDLKLLGLPDQKLDTLSLVDVISPIETIIREVKPRIIYCQYGGDINQDHKIVFDAMLVATRPQESYIETIYAFDTASSTEWGYPRSFVPDTWIDISSVMEKKLNAMRCYQSELRAFPHPRSIEGLRLKAGAWGTQCCMEAAEVFMTIRRVIRNV